MTLHEAIQKVLHTRRPLTAKEIETEIQGNALYVRDDGKFPGANQIRWRIPRYPHLFELVPGSSPQRFRIPVGR